MPEKSRYFGRPVGALLLILLVLPIAIAADTTPQEEDATIQLVSKERALSVLDSVNGTILFVDMQIAIAELERKDLVAAVANLASARGVLKDAVAAFDGGDYVGVVELSYEASKRAQYALVAIPANAPPKTVPKPIVTFDQASRALKSANETVLFVDMQIAEAERARKDVIKPVETLAEARGLFKQASAAFAENDYSGAYDLASDAIKKAQDALAILSEAKQPGILDIRTVVISGAAVVLVALVLYFGPLKGLVAKRQQVPSMYYGPVSYYPQQSLQQPYQQLQRPSPSPSPSPPVLPGQTQPAPYYNRQPYYTAQPAPPYYQPKPFAQPTSPPVQQQQQQQQPPFPQQQQATTKPPQAWQQPQQQQAPRPYDYTRPPYQKPPQKKQQQQ